MAENARRQSRADGGVLTPLGAVLTVRVAASFHRPPLVWFARLWHTLFVETILIPFFARRLRVGRPRAPRQTSPRPLPCSSSADHRTYFDHFAVFYVLRRRLKLRHPICFPVRSNFFYENPLGLLTGAVFSACAMYPPIFRKGRARVQPRMRSSCSIRMSRAPRTKRMNGFHPEGTRSKSDNPYDMLPAKRGAGELALGARPVVIPVFVSGLKNSLTRPELGASASASTRAG